MCSSDWSVYGRSTKQLSDSGSNLSNYACISSTPIGILQMKRLPKVCLSLCLSVSLSLSLPLLKKRSETSDAQNLYQTESFGLGSTVNRLDQAKERCLRINSQTS